MTLSCLHGKSPHKILLNYVPDYSRLKVFGSLCYASSTLAKQREKFSSRAIRCVFLGYPFGQKGYKVYDLALYKTFVSRDVQFHEHLFPYASSPGVAISTPSLFPANHNFLDDLNTSASCSLLLVLLLVILFMFLLHLHLLILLLFHFLYFLTLLELERFLLNFKVIQTYLRIYQVLYLSLLLNMQVNPTQISLLVPGILFLLIFLTQMYHHPINLFWLPLLYYKNQPHTLKLLRIPIGLMQCILRFRLWRLIILGF